MQFIITKALEILKGHFYWLKMLRDVTNIVNKYVTCQMAKSSFKTRLYSPLSVPNHPWDVSMDFIIDLPHTQRIEDAIMVVVDRFSRMSHFVACNRTDNSRIDLYFQEIVRLHGIPKTIL